MKYRVFIEDFKRLIIDCPICGQENIIRKDGQYYEAVVRCPHYIKTALGIDDEEIRLERVESCECGNIDPNIVFEPLPGELKG